MRQETDPSSKASQPQQSEVIVSTADWGDIACQQHAVMGMSPCMSLSQQNGRTMCVERAFTCSSKSLMMFLFHPASELWAKWETDRGLLDLAIGPWTKRDGLDRALFEDLPSQRILLKLTPTKLMMAFDPDIAADPSRSHAAGPWQIERSIRYRVPLKQFGNVGPSHAYTEETFTLHMVGPSSWAASVKAISPFVPMGKCFQVDLQLVAEDLPDGGCKMCVTGAVNFYKPNRLGELLIRRPALAAMQKTYMALFDLISEQDLAYVGPPTPTTLRHDQDLRPPSLQVRHPCMSLLQTPVPAVLTRQVVLCQSVRLYAAAPHCHLQFPTQRLVVLRQGV